MIHEMKITTMKRLFLLLALTVCSAVNVMAQKATFYEAIAHGLSTIHAKRQCSNINGSVKTIEIDLNTMSTYTIQSMLEGRLCKDCNAETALKLLLSPGSVNIEDLDQERTVLEPNEIEIGLMPGNLLSSSMPYLAGVRINVLEVKKSQDESLMGCPVTCQIMERRKSNILGSEGRLIIRPLYITKQDRSKVYCVNSDIFVRGLNRTNVKFWTSFFLPMLFVPGSGAKIMPEDRFIVRIEK